MQQTKQATFKQYVLAGNTLAAREQILVSTHVSLENPGEQDSRELFIAKGSRGKGASVSLKTSLLAVIICIIAGLLMLGSKSALTRGMHAEYAQLNARYQAAQAEEQRLLTEFATKSDASTVCYYAVQSLGMRLAGQQETIGVHAIAMPTTLNSPSMLGSASSSGH